MRAISEIIMTRRTVHSRGISILFISLLTAAFCTACAQETTIQQPYSSTSDTYIGWADTGMHDTNAGWDSKQPPTGANKLTFAKPVGSNGQPCSTQCTELVAPASTVLLEVDYRTSANTPISNAAIVFNTTATVNTAFLSDSVVYTNQSGRAFVQLTAGAEASGTTTVTAQPLNDAQAGTLTFFIEFSQPAAPVLTVTHNYFGTKPITSLEVRLFYQQNGFPTCADVNPDSNTVLPTPAKTAGPIAIGQPATFTDLPGLQAGITQQWTVQLIGPPGAVPVAVGCTAGVVVTHGQSQQITISVGDLPLRFKGSYAITTDMNMYDNLPSSGADAINTFLQVLTDPGTLVLIQTCDNASGITGTLCGLLLSNGQPSGIGLSLATLVNDKAALIIQQQIGADGPTAAQHLVDMLKQMQLSSTITFQAEPVDSMQGGQSTAFPAGMSTEVWETATINWTLGKQCNPNDPNCGLETVPLASVYGSTPQAAFDASVNQSNGLSIAKHTVPLMTYGQLVNYVVEKKVVPHLFGDGTDGFPKVDTYENVAAIILGSKGCIPNYDQCCEEFKTKASAFSIPSFLLGTVKSVCLSSIPGVAGWMRNKMLALSAPLTIGTYPNTPCQAVDTTGDRNVNTLGSVQQKCQWEATFQMGNEVFQPASFWTGVRK
jgi:hypothetical protein